ncbi:MAG: formylglycine-generating enzyme family protein, partial [Planctomycetota bacterium]
RGTSVGDGDAESDEKPAHEVTLTQPFYLGRYEVTQAQWQAAMSSNPSTKSKDPQAPVETVSHDDIASFNRKTGLRLPTEAEWEYACRAGSTAARYGELDAVAWYSGNSGSTTHLVGQKRASALGFHDMLGNVHEWCSDWYSDSEYARCSAGVVDPKGPSTGDSRVLRGGSWNDDDWNCRASNRYDDRPATRNVSNGFRASRTP